MKVPPTWGGAFREEHYNPTIMEIAAKRKEERITDMKKQLRDIYLTVSWREVSRTYFDKSVSWFQQKMYGIDGNGGVGGFTPEEADKLRRALNDLADRIRRAADGIKAPATGTSFD